MLQRIGNANHIIIYNSLTNNLGTPYVRIINIKIQARSSIAITINTYGPMADLAHGDLTQLAI